MASRQGIDRDALHELLALRADRSARVRVYQAELARDLGITDAGMSRVMSKMVVDGRIHRVGSDYHSPMYRVVPLEEWRSVHDGAAGQPERPRPEE